MLRAKKRPGDRRESHSRQQCKTPLAIYILVNDRLLLADLPYSVCSTRSPLGGSGNPVCAVEFQTNVFRIRARRYDKIVFELPLVSVDNVDSGIYPFIRYAPSGDFS